MMDNDSKFRETAIAKFQQTISAGSEELFQLILDPDLDFIVLLLQHPKLDESHLLSLLKRRDLIEEIITQIHRSQKKKLSHRLILALVKSPAISGPLIRNLLPHLRLFELADLCKMPGVSPDQKLAAERTILQRLPTTPLGNKITLARRGTTTVVSELLKEGQPQVFDACLNSPHLNEAAIFQFLRGATASAETISQVARHHRWKGRPNLMLAILKNRKTPDLWFTLWLPKLNLQTIKQLQITHRVHPVKKSLITTELKKRGGL
jgi:hypothetical protein